MLSPVVNLASAYYQITLSLPHRRGLPAIFIDFFASIR